jgi:hypothetical protein
MEVFLELKKSLVETEVPIIDTKIDRNDRREMGLRMTGKPEKDVEYLY